MRIIMDMQLKIDSLNWKGPLTAKELNQVDLFYLKRMLVIAHSIG